MKKRKKTLSAQYLLKISSVFEKNNWIIEKSDGESESQFNRFCQRVLDIGENEKRDLFLELSERYLWLPQENYLECLINALEKVISTQREIIEEKIIYVMPLISPEDRDKVKSALMLSYLFNDVRIRYNKTLKNYRFQLLSSTFDVNKIIEKNVLLLVDDFLGTGKTAEKCLLNLRIEARLYSQVKIVALVAQQEGIDYISKYGTQVIAHIIRNKGMSDYYAADELAKKVKLMEQIEQKMSIRDENKFGYGKSEALVTMCRTPNNTFPVFWEEKGTMKKAPFPRE